MTYFHSQFEGILEVFLVISLPFFSLHEVAFSDLLSTKSHNVQVFNHFEPEVTSKAL